MLSLPRLELDWELWQVRVSGLIAHGMFFFSKTLRTGKGTAIQWRLSPALPEQHCIIPWARTAQLLLCMPFLPVGAHGVLAREGLVTISTCTRLAKMGPNVTPEPISAALLPTGLSVQHPLTIQPRCSGSLHAVHIAKVVHQFVKVGAPSVARYTARRPPALLGVVVCCDSHSTQTSSAVWRKRRERQPHPAVGGPSPLRRLALYNKAC